MRRHKDKLLSVQISSSPSRIASQKDMAPQSVMISMNSSGVRCGLDTSLMSGTVRRRPQLTRASTPSLHCYNKPVQRKVFWMSFVVLGLIADVALPFWWALAATVPIGMASWWIAYRSEWF